jgi:hypothetical protein
MKSLARVLIAAVLACSTPALATSPQAEGFKKLSSGQIRAAFAGKTFSDDTHFSNRYRADGTIEGVSMGKKINNKWKVVKDTLCITDKFGELCYFVWIKGKDAKLVHESSDLVLEGSIK